jgi:hypothetical protein
LLSGILARLAKDEHRRARPRACSHTFRNTFIQAHASTQDYANAAAQSHSNATAQGHDNAVTQGYNAARPGCAGRAAAGFTSGLSSADEDGSGISGDH